MLKFRKLFNVKIVALTVGISFLFAAPSSLHAYPEAKDTLRPHVGVKEERADALTFQVFLSLTEKSLTDKEALSQIIYEQERPHIIEEIAGNENVLILHTGDMVFEVRAASELSESFSYSDTPNEYVIYELKEGEEIDGYPWATHVLVPSPAVRGGIWSKIFGRDEGKPEEVTEYIEALQEVEPLAWRALKSAGRLSKKERIELNAQLEEAGKRVDAAREKVREVPVPDGYDSWYDYAKKVHKLGGSPQAVLRAIRSPIDSEPLTRNKIATHPTVNRTEGTITRDLAFLISADVLVKEGIGNEATYQIAPELLANLDILNNIQRILDEGFENIEAGFKDQTTIRDRILKAMSSVIDWGKRAEQAFQNEYGSYRVNDQHISPPQKARELLKTLHDLEWLDLPSFTQKGGPGGRIAYSFNMPDERIDIVGFKGAETVDEVSEFVDRFTSEDFLTLSGNQKAAIIVTDVDIARRLEEHEELKSLIGDKVFIVRLEPGSPAVDQWESLLGTNISYDFRSMSVTDMLNNKDLIEALAKAK